MEETESMMLDKLARLYLFVDRFCSCHFHRVFVKCFADCIVSLAIVSFIILYSYYDYHDYSGLSCSYWSFCWVHSCYSGCCHFWNCFLVVLWKLLDNCVCHLPWSDVLMHFLKNNINQHRGPNRFPEQTSGMQGQPGCFHGDTAQASTSETGLGLSADRGPGVPSTSRTNSELTFEEEVVRLLNCTEHYLVLGLSWCEDIDVSQFLYSNGNIGKRQCWSILIRIWAMKRLQKLLRNFKMHMRFYLILRSEKHMMMN